jgi:predicted ATPase
LRRIHAKGFSDNIVDLMAGKLDRLPEATHEALRQLACLGNSAGLPLLSIVLQDSEEAIVAMLGEAVMAGLVCDLDGAFAFTHDRVQEAAYALIPEEWRAQHHLRIGRSIIAKLTQDEMEEEIFDVVKPAQCEAKANFQPRRKGLGGGIEPSSREKSESVGRL